MTGAATILINANFNVRVVVRPDQRTFIASPAAGVERVMLDRIGGEIARATSLVRYAPNAAFPEHVHGGGEEFLVLEGSFHDAAGDYPAGTYVRNPIGTSHAPWAGPKGCLLFVKLHQFSADDRRQVRIDLQTCVLTQAGGAGVWSCDLHRHGPETITFVRWEEHRQLPRLSVRGGLEVLVLTGQLSDELGAHPAGTWLRSPDGLARALTAAPNGATALVRTGHLAFGP